MQTNQPDQVCDESKGYVVNSGFDFTLENNIILVLSSFKTSFKSNKVHCTVSKASYS